MFLTLLFSLAQAKRICVCNKECSFLCPKDTYIATQLNSQFNDYLVNTIKDENEVEIDFYSKEEGFFFEIDSSCFGDSKVILKNLADSKIIKVNIKEKFQSFNKVIDINPNFQVNLPDLIPFQSSFMKTARKNVLDTPEETPVPVSISTLAMTKTGGFACDTQNACQNSIDTSGTCGERCWTTGNGLTSFEYSFKGVKYAIYGTNDPNHGKFNLYLNDNLVREINQRTTSRQPYTLLYISDELEYGEYTIKASGTEVFEIYKFAFWPSMKAKRINSTDMGTTLNWVSESDKIGGQREYTNNVGATKNQIVECSKIWIYGTMDPQHGEAYFQFDEDTVSFSEYSQTRKELTLVYESPQFPHGYHSLYIEARSTILIYCIYYLYDVPPQTQAPNPSKSPSPGSSNDYINQRYTGSLKDDVQQVQINQQSNINEISGCTFTDIFIPRKNYYFRISKEIIISDNTFINTNLPPNVSDPAQTWAAPFWADYNGKLSIIRCVFIKQKHRTLDTVQDGNIFNCNQNSLDVTFQSCQFINCGDSAVQSLIGNNQRSHGTGCITLSDCTITFDDAENSCKIIDAFTQGVVIDNCKFTRCGPIYIHPADTNLPHRNQFEITNNLISYIASQFIHVSSSQTKPIIQGNTFQNCEMRAGNYLISYYHNLDEIEIVNNTFQYMSISQGTLFGGSTTSWYKRLGDQTSKLIYRDCNFSDNENRHTESPFNQGGAVQFGYSLSISATSLVFTNCQFIRNKCLTGKGGALAISVDQDVSIIDCLFEDNTASQEGGAIYIWGKIEDMNNHQQVPESTLDSITITNCQFNGNKASEGVGIYIEEEIVKFINVNITSCVFANNDETTNKVLIHCKCERFNFEFNEVKYDDLSKSCGVLLLDFSNSVNLAESVFTKCQIESDAVVKLNGADQSTSTISNCNFVDCKANKYAVIISKGTSTITDSNFTFTDNSNACSGLEVDSPTTVSISGCNFVRNNNNQGKGSLYIHRETGTATATVNDIVFDSCDGAEFVTLNIDLNEVSNQNEFTVRNLNIINAVADSHYIYQVKTNKNLKLVDCTFQNCHSNNQFGGGSGAKIVIPEKISFENCKWLNNYCSENGGAFQFGGSSESDNRALSFTSCIFSQNKSPKFGGALAVINIKDLLIADCKFPENAAAYSETKSIKLLDDLYGEGGAVYINVESVSGEPTIEIRNTHFSSNQASDALDVCLRKADNVNLQFSIEDSTFTGNGQSGSHIISEERVSLDTSVFNSTAPDVPLSNPIQFDGSAPAIYYDMTFSSPMVIKSKQSAASFEHCIFKNVKANDTITDHQYVLTIHCAQFQLIDCAIEYENEYKQKRIGAICIDAYCNVTITRSTFMGCDVQDTDQSAGIYYQPLSSGVINPFERMELVEVTFDSMRGVNARCFKITISYDSFISDDITIQNCPNGGHTGALYFKGTNQFTFDNWKFKSNAANATLSGGCGLWIAPDDSNKGRDLVISFINCHWLQNHAVNSIDSNIDQNREFLYNGLGGAFQFGFSQTNANTLLNFFHCTFEDNVADREGGALAIQTTRNCYIDDCHFIGNRAHNIDKCINGNKDFCNQYNDNSGGAIFVDPDFKNSLTSSASGDQNIQITSCEFRDNSAPDGSAISIRGKEATYRFSDLLLINNKGPSSVFYSTAAHLYFQDSVLEVTKERQDSIKNRAIELAVESSIILTSITFRGFRLSNSQNNFGAAIKFSPQATSAASLLDVLDQRYEAANCTFEDCQCTSGSAGAIYAKNVQTVVVTNCLFDNCGATGNGVVLYIDEGVKTFKINPTTKIINTNAPGKFMIQTLADSFDWQDVSFTQADNNNVKGFKFNKAEEVLLRDVVIEGISSVLNIDAGVKKAIVERCRFYNCISGDDNVVLIQNQKCQFLNNEIEFDEDLPVQGRAFRIANAGDIRVLYNKFINCNPTSESRYTIVFDVPQTVQDADTVYFNYNLIKGVTRQKKFSLINFNLNNNFNFDHNIISDCRNSNNGNNGYLSHINNLRSDLVITNLTFHNCVSGSQLGGSFGCWFEASNANNNHNYKISFVDCHFTNNEHTSTEGGGAFEMGGAGSAKNRFETLFDGCEFTSNSAASYGGALCIKNLLTTIRGCTFRENKALGNQKNSKDCGGAIYLGNNAGNCHIENCQFTSNTDKLGEGAAIYINVDQPSLENSVIIDSNCRFISNYNINNNHNYAIHSSSPSFSISDSLIETNAVPNKCSGLCFDGQGSQNSVFNVTFKKLNNQESETIGLAIEIKEGVESIEVQSCYFTLCGVRHDSIPPYVGRYTIYDCSKNSLIDNCFFEGNAVELAGPRAPAIRVVSFGSHQITNCRLLLPMCKGNGAISYEPLSGDESEEHFVFNNITIDTPEGDDRVAFDFKVHNAANIDISDVTIENAKEGKCLVGCEIFGDNTNSFTFDRFKFINNICKASYGGGSGIWLYPNGVNDHLVTFSDCIFRDNTAGSGVNHAGYGGGIQIFNNENTGFKFSVINCTFNNNHAERFGGALTFASRNTITIEDCQFIGNDANECGGAIYIDNSETDRNYKISISRCTFQNNDCNEGSAIYISLPPQSEFYTTPRIDINDNCQFSKNSQSEGSLLVSYSHRLFITSVSFDFESVDRSCRAIYLADNSYAEITYTNFRKCQANGVESDRLGNSIYVGTFDNYNSRVVINNCNFLDCGKSGYPVYVLGNSLSFKDNVINYTSNQPDYAAGGLYAVGGEISRNEFKNTYADASGRAVTLNNENSDRRLTFQNNTFIGCNGVEVRCFDLTFKTSSKHADINKIYVRDCPSAPALLGSVLYSAPSTWDDFSFTDFEFTNNKVSNEASTLGIGGGAGFIIRSSAAIQILIRRCLFENNTVTGARGGGFQVGGHSNTYSPKYEFTDCMFKGNTAPNGGGLSLETIGSWSVKNCEFENNQATEGGRTSGGGALFIDANPTGAQLNGRCTITSCTFRNNRANSLYGTMIYLSAGTGTAEVNIASSNNLIIQDESGYAIYNAYQNLVLDGVQFSYQGSGNQNCGGIGSGGEKGKTILRGCTFTGIGFSSTTNLGNAMRLFDTTAVEIDSCQFNDCAGNNNLNNFVIYGSDRPGHGKSLTVTNSNFVFTSTSRSSAGICIERFGTFTIRACQFINCWYHQLANYGGAIRYGYLENTEEENLAKCRVSIRECTFQNCNNDLADNKGGRVIQGYPAAMTVEFSNCTIRDTVDGGYIFKWETRASSKVDQFNLNEFAFINNTASCSDGGGGAGVWISGVDHVLISDCSFVGNRMSDSTADLGGGAMAFASDPELCKQAITYQNCFFKDNKVNKANQHGGALFIRSPTRPTTVTDCTFNNTYEIGNANLARFGGAIYIHADIQGGVFIEDSQFNNLHADADGNAILIAANAPKVVISGCTFSDCHHNNGFSVIWTFGDDLEFIDNTITFENSARSSRGIFVCNPSRVLISQSNFYNCVYREHGCGFAYNAGNNKDPNNKESITIEDTIFDKTISTSATTGKASAIYLNVYHPVVLQKVTLQNCNPPADKYIIYIESPTIIPDEQPQIFNQCIFINCTTTYTDNHAGGIGLMHDKIVDLVFDSCEFYNLRSSDFGGAAAFRTTKDDLDAYSVNFNSCKFTNNSVTGNNGKGGSLYFDVTYQITVSDCNFTHQSLNGYGGSICIQNSVDPLIKNNQFHATNETSQGHGNAIYLARGLPIATISQNTFVDCGDKGSVIESEAVEFIFNSGNTIQFSENKGSRGINFPVQCTARLSNSTIMGCSFSGEGGGILYNGAVSSQPELIQMDNVIFDNNNATNGCAILMRIRQIPNVTACTVRNHVSGKYIFCMFYQTELLQELAIDNCLFEGNYFNSGIDGGGSGIWIAAAQDLTQKGYPIGLNSCVFRNNRASQFGGAFAYGISRTLQNVMVNMRNCEFYDNVADGGKGGAIWIDTQVEFTIEGCSFNGDNTPTNNKEGHAIYCHTRSKVSIVDTVFTDCGSNRIGTAIVFTGTKIHMEESTIQYSNETLGARGMEITVATTIELVRSNFVKCNAGGWGGGLYFHVTGAQSDTAVLLFEDLVFDNNTATNGCGALFDTSIPPDIHGCTFRNHQSGIYVFAIFFSQLQLYYDLRTCEFESNAFNAVSGSEDGGGSGVWISNKKEIAQQRSLQLFFTECQWRDNISPYVGGGFAIGRSETVKATELVLDSCTFSGNTAAQHAGAVWIATQSNIEIKNCAFRNNNALSGAGSILIESTAPSCVINKCTFTRENADVKANSIYINSLTTETYLTENTFTDCGYLSESNEVVSINCNQFEFVENTIAFTNILNSCRGLTIESSGTHVIRDSTFSKCNLTTGNKFGGGIYYSCPDAQVNNDEYVEDITIDGCTFDYCIADSGSALYINPKNIPEITNNNVQNSKIGQYTLTFILKRGALTDYTLEGWTFYNNRCAPKVINSNTKYDGGGSGIYIANQGSSANLPFNLTFHKCNWTLNSSPYRGGALTYGDSQELKNINLIFDECTFLRNNCKTQIAGALWLSSSSEASLLITKCTFEANKALSNTSIGGTIYLDSSYQGRVDIIDTEFTKNSAIDANALFIEQNVQAVNIERCHIISNGNTNSQIVNYCGELNIVDSEVGFGSYTLSARSICCLARCRLTVLRSTIANCKTNDNSICLIPANSLWRGTGSGIMYEAVRNTPHEEQIIIEETTFDNCRAKNGAALLLNINEPIVFNKNTIQNCRGGNFIMSIFSHVFYIDQFNFEECTFRHNKFTTPANSNDGGGSALWISNDVTILPLNGYNTLNFKDCIWIENTATGAGGAMAYGQSPTIGNTALTYDHCQFVSNLANGANGGALWLQMSRPLLIKDCTFESNSASGTNPQGGAITINSSSSSINIVGCTFTSNSARDANAISITRETPDINITGCTFTDCGSGNNNNVIRIKSKAVTVDNCNFQFTSRYAASRAIAITCRCNAVIRDSQIRNARSNQFGAGLYYRNDDGTQDDENLLIEGCLFDSCEAPNGQVIVAYLSTPIVLRNNLIWNQKTGKFIISVFYIDDVNETFIEDCYFEHNYFDADPSSGGGSGLWLSRDDRLPMDVILNGCTFRDNECRYLGGGFAYGYSKTMSFANIELNDCNFINNTAGNDGGAISFQTRRSKLTIHSCFFDGNKAGGANYGGAIYINKESPDNDPEEIIEGDIVIEDCRFARNSAFGGGAIYCSVPESLKLNSNIFSENVAYDKAPSLYLSIRETCKQDQVITNCKFDFLKAPGEYQIYIDTKAGSTVIPEIALIFTGNCFTHSGDGETVAHIKSDYQGAIQLNQGNCFDLPRETSIEFANEENLQAAEGIFDCHTCQVPAIPTSPPTNMPTATPAPTPEATIPPPTASMPPSDYIPPATEVVTEKPSTSSNVVDPTSNAPTTVTSSSSSSSQTSEPSAVPTTSSSTDDSSNNESNKKSQSKKIVLIAGIAVAAVVIIVVIIILVWLFVCRNRTSIQQEESIRNSEMNEETISGITGEETNNQADDPIWAGTSGTQDNLLFDGNENEEGGDAAQNNDFEESWGAM